MLIALSDEFDLFLAGQVSTHRAHPVQSSTLTLRTKRSVSENSFPFALSEAKPSGAEARRASSAIPVRITEWGQTKTHLLHWMQLSGSQTGTSWAMLRFS